MNRLLGALFPHSLKLRLMAAAAVWAVPVLVLAGLLLYWSFLSHLERQIDEDLEAYQRELLAAAQIDADGVLRLTYTPADPRFSRTFSGWYWQIAAGAEILHQSRSAGPSGPGSLPLLSTALGIVELDGPGGRELRILASEASLPGGTRPLTVLVAAPCDEIDAALHQFGLHVLATFAILGVVFLMTVYFQVGFGLRPLADLRREIGAIRSGRREHLGERYPREIAPVVEEVNALIDHNRQLLDRARHEASNLAHAIKNPLSVLTHEIVALGEKKGATMAQQVQTITAQVERILKRIRTAGPSRAGHARSEIAPICQDLAYSLGIIYRERNLAITAAIEPDLAFAGDAEDLAEMLGNLADNACKWARSAVTLTARREGDVVRVAVEDDGPGIAAAAREAVLGRGRRLDERVPGSGLGLDIVREIVTLYRGRLALADATSGGLRVELDLPAA